MGRTEFLTCNQITSEPWWLEQTQRPQLERKGALRSARASAPQKCLTLPTLLEMLETRFIANLAKECGYCGNGGERQQGNRKDQSFSLHLGRNRGCHLDRSEFHTCPPHRKPVTHSPFEKLPDENHQSRTPRSPKYQPHQYPESL